MQQQWCHLQKSFAEVGYCTSYAVNQLGYLSQNRADYSRYVATAATAAAATAAVMQFVKISCRSRLLHISYTVNQLCYLSQNNEEEESKKF